jgi:hypothetical protein
MEIKMKKIESKRSEKLKRRRKRLEERGKIFNREGKCHENKPIINPIKETRRKSNREGRKDIKE